MSAALQTSSAPVSFFTRSASSAERMRPSADSSCGLRDGGERREDRRHEHYAPSEMFHGLTTLVGLDHFGAAGVDAAGAVAAGRGTTSNVLGSPIFVTEPLTSLPSVTWYFPGFTSGP